MAIALKTLPCKKDVRWTAGTTRQKGGTWEWSHKFQYYINSPTFSSPQPTTHIPIIEIPWGGGWALPYCIWPIRGCATQKGMVFASLSLEQGLQICISVWNSVYFFWTLQHGRSYSFAAKIALQMNFAVTVRGPTACLLEPPIQRSTVSNIFIYFHHFVWNRVVKLCLFGLEQGQVPREILVCSYCYVKSPHHRCWTCTWIHSRRYVTSLMWEDWTSKTAECLQRRLA